MKELKIKDRVLCSGEKPLVCVPLMGEDNEAIKEHLERIIQEEENTNIDIVEFRGDFYYELENLDKLSDILRKVREALSNKILLFTIRSPREGGVKRSYDVKSIEEINRFVIDHKLADMVDVELFTVDDEQNTAICPAIVSLAKERGVKIIMSNHDFDKTPAKEVIVKRLARMQELGADVAKLAVMPHSEDDLLTLLQATYEMKVNYNDTPVVTMSMGSTGAISRIAGEVFGSAITFGAVGEVSAPGQIPVNSLNDMLDMVHTYCIDK